jgi:hypothetical protein
MAGMIATGCFGGSESNLSQKPQIGYRFYSSLDSVGDSSARVDEVRHGILTLFSRLQDNSEINGAWTNWPDTGMQRAITNALDRHSQVQFRLILDPREVAVQGLSSEVESNDHRLAQHSQLILENKGNEKAGILNPNAQGGRMNVNMVLFQNLQPQGPDNGAFTVLMQGSGLDGSGAITEALCIYGDSSLYERCLSYWEGMRESKTEFTFAKSHTYSNLHDHQAWFFPDILAEKPENAVGILAQLEDAIVETHQPVKVRMVMTGADVCHLEFFEMLVRLQMEYEADVRVILKDTSTTALQVARMLERLPKGSLRIFPARDSSHRSEMHARFLLVDGPYEVTENNPAESRRMCFFFGDDFVLANQREHSAIWLRISDKRVFMEAENHWNRLWKMTEGVTHTRMSDTRNARSRCAGDLQR